MDIQGTISCLDTAVDNVFLVNNYHQMKDKLGESAAKTSLLISPKKTNMRLVNTKNTIKPVSM